MADLLTAVKTVQRNGDEKPEPLLTAVSTLQNHIVPKDNSGNAPPPALTTSKSTAAEYTKPDEILQILRAQPSLETVVEILHRLGSVSFKQQHLKLDAPGPLQAQIINALVTQCIPTCFEALDQGSRMKLAICLRNIAGIGALVARIRLLSKDAQSAKGATANAPGLSAIVRTLKLVLPTDFNLGDIWIRLNAAIADPAQRRTVWKELVILMGSGKIVSTIAQAEDGLKGSSHSTDVKWLSNGSEYAAWLGRAITNMLIVEHTEWPAAQLVAKALSIGYNHIFVRAVFIDVDVQSGRFATMLANIPAHVLRQILETVLQCLSAMSPDGDESRDRQLHQVSEITAFISDFVEHPDGFRKLLVSHLTSPALNGTISTVVRAACIAALAKVAPDELDGLLETMFTTFGNELFINHAPVVQQEGIAQSILLSAGTLHRTTPMAVLMISRSSGHMQGVSNRLHSSNLRARWLGMVVGTAISDLVDKDGSKMDFGTEGMKTDEAKWYINLVKAGLSGGSLEGFRKLRDAEKHTEKRRTRKTQPTSSERLPIIGGKQSFGPVRPPVQTEVVGEKVAELLDDEASDDEDDLKPYAKPDDDPEDSDEDATLVNRDKPRPPVYIRDLMHMLRDTSKPDRFEMGIKHASMLIRRKLSFGKEVSDHAEELGLLLCDLQDPFDTNDFDELRLQALIAILLSDVSKMAPWLSRQAFTGDYSLSQRCIMLSALGLGGREIAGLADQDNELNPALPPSNSFPSKRLAGRLHTIYDPGSASVKRLEAASNSVEHRLIKPLALSAADKVTSDLNAVKVRSFSSRLSTKNRTKRKPIPNGLAKIFATAFFFPLVSRYQQELAAYGQGSVYASSPFVQVTFLKTLALLLHASGPATLQLPEVTAAFWDVLLALRVQAISDISILEAVLFSLLTLLEVNTEYGQLQRLALDNPKQLMETQQWVELTFERIGGGNLVVDGSAEESRNRTLAAGVLVKCREVIEAYQGQLTGLV